MRESAASLAAQTRPRAGAGEMSTQDDEVRPLIEQTLGQALLTIARGAIGRKLGFRAVAEPKHDALAANAATFVTLRRAGALRGCIGSLDPVRPLGVDTRENALAAAFRDPRFPPVSAAEYQATSVEVSLLSPRERIAFGSEHELLRCLRPGVDGVILEYDSHRATFLPQVWDSLADPRTFLVALKRKAGLPEDFWSVRVNVSRYRVTKWAESEFLSSEMDR